MNIKQINYKTIGELKTLTEQYKTSKAISEMLFKQNYKARQEAILKELFKDD